jgi:hypothetical protein
LEAGAQGTERESAGTAAQRKEEDPEEALRRARTRALVRHARAVDAIFEAVVVELPQSAKQSLGLASWGTVALDRGDHDRAWAALEEGLAYARQAENWYLACSALHYLSRVAFERGDYGRAAALLWDDLMVQRELAPTAPLGAMACVEGVALLAVVQNQPAPAARLFGTAATLRDRAEDIERPERKRIAPWVATVREELGEEAFTREWATGSALSPEVALTEAAGLLVAWSWTESADPARKCTQASQ